MMSFCAREVELVEKMFLIENSGCRWTQTSLQMSRRRKQDLYLRFEYWHNIAADESMIPLIQTGSVEFDLLKNMLTRDNLQNVNISQIFPRSSSYKIHLMTSHIEWTRWMCFGDNGMQPHYQCYHANVNCHHQYQTLSYLPGNLEFCKHFRIKTKWLICIKTELATLVIIFAVW